MSSSTDSETRQRGRVKDRLDPSTSHRDTSSQSRLANIPEPVIDDLVDDDFGDDWTFPEVGSGDLKIEKFLHRVFGEVKPVLGKDKVLRPQLANDDEFIANVKSKGEWDFINSLKSMAEAGVWTSLFKNGTLLFLRFRTTLISSVLRGLFKTKTSAKADNQAGRCAVGGRCAIHAVMSTSLHLLIVCDTSY